MDVIAFEDEMNQQNEAPDTGQGGLTMEKQNKAYDRITQNEGPNGRTETVELAAKRTIVNCSAAKDGEGSTIQEEFIGLTLHKESEVEERNNAGNSKKGPGREVNEKASRTKSITTVAKKKKDGKIGSVTSKQPLAIATNRRLSNDRISGSTTVLDSGRPTKLVSASRPAHLSQETRMSCTSSPATNTKDSIGLREKARHLMHLKQGPPAKVDGTEHSSSPEAGGTEPQRTGGLPAYGFSFKCDERAQKRKEFYAKLEEKTHAKEVEKTTMQAKTQENQEAEIKMLRKSLMFKATPMPNFYLEPAPPKVELKKMPPTRAKSPKLSRARTSRIKDSDVNSSHSSQSGRFSLDVKITQNRVAKGSTPQHYKKPLRKSLPKLPSETATPANTTEDSAAISHLSEHPNLEPEAEHIYEPNESQSGINADRVAENPQRVNRPESEPVASNNSTDVR